ncbi:MAG: DUF1800 family protein [Planctomycetota bacterium]
MLRPAKSQLPYRSAAVVPSLAAALFLGALGLGATMAAFGNAPNGTDAPAKIPADLNELRHLIARTGFGCSEAELTRIRGLTYEEAVDRLLDEIRIAPCIMPPEEIQHAANGTLAGDGKQSSPEEQRQQRERRREHGEMLKAWWLTELLQTSSPITEHLTLFWHNHFTSSLRKVRLPALMWQQNALFRRHAAGNFAELLRAVCRDPAMLIYLDTQQNNRKQPNENFARELLELFTLGEGHFTESDVKAAARAFTGWRVDRETGEFRIVERQHDGGEKQFLGKTGNFGGDDIVSILLANSRTAEHIVEKFWREFVSDSSAPSDRPRAEIVRLAGVLRAADYQLRPLLEALFTSAAFRERKNRGVLIQSPIELVVGTLRRHELAIDEPARLLRLCRGLGQDLFDPPNVKGWPGGREWITSSSLLLRQQFTVQLVGGDRDGRKMEDKRVEMKRSSSNAAKLAEWFAGLGDDSGARLTRARTLMFALPELIPIAERDPQSQVSDWLTDPVYQLK